MRRTVEKSQQPLVKLSLFAQNACVQFKNIQVRAAAQVRSNAVLFTSISPAPESESKEFSGYVNRLQLGDYP